MLLLMACWLAFAWDFDPTQLDATAPDDVAVTLDRAGWLSGGFATVTDHSGTEIRRVSTDAVQLELVDTTGGGFTDVLVLCGPSGLEQVTLADGGRTSLDSAACTGMTTQSGGVIAQATQLVAWTSAGGGLGSPEVLGDGILGADLFAYTVDPPGVLKPSFAVAKSGGEQVLIYVGRDPAVTVDVASPIRSLAANDVWIWVSTKDATSTIVQDGALSGTRLPADRPLAGGDVSGDGSADVIAGVESGLLVETESWVTLHQDATNIEHVAAVLGPECTVAITGGADGVHLMQAVDCGEDSDGDGLTSEAGDCNDGDPNINPGAVETCDGSDQNCDGHIDDVGVLVEGRLQADEGQMSNLLPATSSCEGGALLVQRIEVSGTDEAVICDLPFTQESGSVSELSCTAGDDGEFTVQIWLGGDTPTVVPFTVINLPPTLLGAEGNIRVSTTGGTFLVAQDYDQDVTFEVIDGPRWFEVAADGMVINAAPREGRWGATIRLDDQDGGVTEVEVQLEGFTPSTSCVNSDCNTSGSGLAWPFSLVLLVLVRRRRQT